MSTQTAPFFPDEGRKGCYYNLNCEPMFTGASKDGNRVVQLYGLGDRAIPSELKTLKWSNEWIPKIGERVGAEMNGFGPSEVISYFMEAGWLGVEVKPDKRPDWHIKQHGNNKTTVLIFGAEIRRPKVEAKAPDNSICRLLKLAPPNADCEVVLQADGQVGIVWAGCFYGPSQTINAIAKDALLLACNTALDTLRADPSAGVKCKALDPDDGLGVRFLPLEDQVVANDAPLPGGGGAEGKAKTV